MLLVTGKWTSSRAHHPQPQHLCRLFSLGCVGGWLVDCNSDQVSEQLSTAITQPHLLILSRQVCLVIKLWHLEASIKKFPILKKLCHNFLVAVCVCHRFSLCESSSNVVASRLIWGKYTLHLKLSQEENECSIYHITSRGSKRSKMSFKSLIL